MFEEITDPIFGAFDSAVSFVSDVGADLTGFRCTREGTGQLPFATHQQAVAPAQIRRTAPRSVPTPPRQVAPPARAGFTMKTRG